MSDKKIKIKQIKSTIGASEAQVKVVRALGLKKKKMKLNLKKQKFQNELK